MKRAFFVTLGIVVSVACFALSLQGTNQKQLTAAFAGANYWSLPVMLGLLFLFYWLKTLRWQWLLAPVAKLTFGQLFPPMLIGFAANNILPAHLGEFVRVFVVRKKYGVPATTVLSTVVLERIFDVLAILALSSCSAKRAALSVRSLLPWPHSRNRCRLFRLLIWLPWSKQPGRPLH